MDAPVPLTAVAMLAATALVLRSDRARAWAMLAALALAPVILVAHIWDTDQVRPLRDDPGLLAAAVAGGVVAVGLLALLFARRPALLLPVAVAALPFRIPIASGGSTANLLVPLYLVVAGGTIAFALRLLRAPDERATGGGEPERRGDEPHAAEAEPRAGEAESRAGEAEPRPGALEWALGAYLVLYAVQAAGSADFGRALENVVFFYVPFALLFVLLRRRGWTPRALRASLAVVVALAVALAGVGFVEYATRHLFLNPKVIASNQLEDYFRVNSLFFDPNIYGRFLAVTMLLVAAWLLWSSRRREVVAAGVMLAVLWGALVLTFSQSSFASLLVGLTVLGGLRWSARRALALGAAGLAVAAVFVALAPGAIRVDLGSSESADAATSGRYDLMAGAVRLFERRPLAGWGSGAFAREYRRAEDVSAERATSASHTTPLTVAAEQGVAGLLAYLAVVALILRRLLRRASESPWRAAVAAAFAAVLVHSLMYAAFLEDPLTWALAGLGTALALRAPPARRVRAAGRRRAAAAPEPAPAAR
jgi:O-antigen ligase